MSKEANHTPSTPGSSNEPGAEKKDNAEALIMAAQEQALNTS